MLQILYLTAFAAIGFLTIRNLIRNLIVLGQSQAVSPRRQRQPLHPEMLDEDGNVTDEPLLVIRSTNLEEARSRLDALYRGDSDDDLEASV